MTLPVFLDPELTEGCSQIVLSGSEGHHAAKSMRLQPGEELVVTDGKGLRAHARIDSVESSHLQLEVLDWSREHVPTLSVTVAQALAKGGRDEMAVEICTELGADAIIPWQADRSIVRWKADRAAKGRDKWQTQAVMAAKQSRRAFVPEVAPCVTSRELTALMRDYDTVLICHESAETPVDQVPWGDRVLVVVGPEGGISDSELEAFAAAGGTPVSLGPHVLRSSTAGAVCLMAVNIISGRNN